MCSRVAREGPPIGQGGRAPVLVDLPVDKVSLKAEMVEQAAWTEADFKMALPIKLLHVAGASALTVPDDALPDHRGLARRHPDRCAAGRGGAGRGTMIRLEKQLRETVARDASRSDWLWPQRHLR